MIALSSNQYNILTLHSSTSHLTCCRLYRFSVTHYHFYTNTPFFRFVLHPHSKRNTYVNLSSFESLIRRLSHHHPQRHLYFTMTNAILSNQQNKIKLIETTAIWWSKHHSTHLSSSDRFYVALLPARKTTITFTPENGFTPQSGFTPHYGKPLLQQIWLKWEKKETKRS